MVKSFLDFVNSSRFNKYFLTAFLSLWVIFFTTSLMTKSCINKTDMNKKISYCNVAIIVSFPIHLFSNIRVRLFFEKGVAQSNLGNTKAATESFLVAIEQLIDENHEPLNKITSETNRAFFQLLDMISLEGKKSDAYINFMIALDKYKK